jgi:FAD/FMN-containing dehydrogenase
MCSGFLRCRIFEPENRFPPSGRCPRAGLFLKVLQYLPAFNLRTALAPALRALCKSEAAVAAMVDWVRDQNVPFAIRCGGHSFEGFSQSRQVVIDVRGIDAVATRSCAVNNSPARE